MLRSTVAAARGRPPFQDRVHVPVRLGLLAMAVLAGCGGSSPRDPDNLTEEDLYGSSRSQTVALARQIAMYLCREMTSLSLPKIGQLFGNRDHTTVMYATKKIEKLMKEKRSVYTQVTELTARSKQAPAR